MHRPSNAAGPFATGWYATTGRDSTAACAPCGRATCSSSGSSTAWAATSPISSTPCRTCRPAAWACGCSPARARRSTPPPRPAASCSHLRGAGRVRAGADPRTHLSRVKAARARGRKGGRKFALSKAQVRLAQAAMAHRDTSVSELCRELGIRPVTLYRYVGPQSQLRKQGQKVLGS